MTVASTCTFDLDAPKRPALADVQNGPKENDPAGVTVPPHVPSAEEFNQMAALVVALASVSPIARISVAYSGGNPVITNFVSVSGSLIAGDLTIARTSSTSISITWPAGSFPTPSGKPMVCTNVDGTSVYSADVVAISNGVRVRTRAYPAGGDNDYPFTVWIV